jgi:heme/copper-type cytochrome/quinol oxidase subunit 2
VDQVANELHTGCHCRSGLFFGWPLSFYAQLQPGQSEQKLYDMYPDDVRNKSHIELGCQQCPDGADCHEPGMVFSDIGAQSGWWRPYNNSLVFYQCLKPEHCEGGVTSACEAYRTGPLCAICQEGTLLTSLGTCAPCADSQSLNIFYTVLIAVIIVIGLILMFFLVLRSDRAAMRAIKKLDDEERNKGKGGSLEARLGGGAGAGTVAEHVKPVEDTTTTTTTTAVSGNGDDKAAAAGTEKAADDGAYFDEDGQYITKTYRPTLKPNLTYKLKIMVSFLQITTNMTDVLNMPWPTYFHRFINVFNVFNLDFLQWTSFGCIGTVDYYIKFLLATLIPMAIILGIVVFYLLPYYARHRGNDDDMKAARKRQRRKAWKLVLFTLFLVYPKVSSLILRMYVCKTVEGVDYLKGDFTRKCYDATWKKYLGWNITMIFAYPIGVPLWFFYLLWRYRKRFQEPGVLLELGFLYDGYDKRVWWFELVDMTHKLILTSILAFFPADAQLPFGMCIATLYLMIILLAKPYQRKGDDRLHMFAQVEISLLMLAGFVFYKEGVTDNYNVIISVFLILVTIAFIFVSSASRLTSSRNSSSAVSKATKMALSYLVTARRAKPKRLLASLRSLQARLKTKSRRRKMRNGAPATWSSALSVAAVKPPPTCS